MNGCPLLRKLTATLNTQGIRKSIEYRQGKALCIQGRHVKMEMIKLQKAECPDASRSPLVQHATCSPMLQVSHSFPNGFSRPRPVVDLQILVLGTYQSRASRKRWPSDLPLKSMSTCFDREIHTTGLLEVFLEILLLIQSKWMS